MQNKAGSATRSRRSRARKRRRVLLAATVAAIAIGCALALWRFRAAAPPAVAVASPIPSPRTARIVWLADRPRDAPAWTGAQASELERSLDDALAPALGSSLGHSIVVLDDRGNVLLGRAAYRAVAPASVQKLIVASAALAALGPEFAFHTLLTARQYPDATGSLNGPLYFVGSGDPSFRSDALERGIAQLSRAGIKHIGGVVIDTSAFRSSEINAHWNTDDASEDYAAPSSPVSLDGDTVEFHVIGTAPGRPAQVTFVPDNDVVSTSGNVVTSSNGEDDVTIGGASAPNAFRLSGSIPPGAEEKFWLPVYGIPHYLGSVLMRMLDQYDITVDVPPRAGAAPLDGVILWDRRSPAVPILVRHMLVHSDNHFAEQLLRTLGARAQAGGPDDQGGVAVERRILAEAAIPTPGLHLVDGSGLSGENRLAAITLARTLARFEPQLYLLLPQGGREGTLKDYDFTTALGRVRAKTGHLGNVASLAGYVNTMHHGRVIFAFLVDGSPGNPDAAFVRAIDRLAAM